MIPLRGKVALITGGSRGIGLAIAHAFARHGASTILVGRDDATLQKAVSSVKKEAAAAAEGEDQQGQPLSSSSPPSPPPAAGPPYHASAVGDVRDPEMWTGLLARLKAGQLGRGGGVDVLVNCAGVAQKSLLLSTGPEEIEDVLDTNLKATVLGCKYVAAHMVRTRRLSRAGRGGGVGGGGSGLSIINVSSVMAKGGGFGATVYAASKAGILGFTSALAAEISPFGIRVNALVPGYIETDMIQGLDPENLSRLVPLKRVGRVDEVADAAVFLAQNSYVNNCHLTIDGGLSSSINR